MSARIWPARQSGTGVITSTSACLRIRLDSTRFRRGRSVILCKVAGKRSPLAGKKPRKRLPASAAHAAAGVLGGGSPYPAGGSAGRSNPKALHPSTPREQRLADGVARSEPQLLRRADGRRHVQLRSEPRHGAEHARIFRPVASHRPSLPQPASFPYGLTSLGIRGRHCAASGYGIRRACDAQRLARFAHLQAYVPRVVAMCIGVMHAWGCARTSNTAGADAGMRGTAALRASVPAAWAQLMERERCVRAAPGVPEQSERRHAERQGLACRLCRPAAQCDS